MGEPSGEKSLDESSPRRTELKNTEGRAKYNILFDKYNM